MNDDTERDMLMTMVSAGHYITTPDAVDTYGNRRLNVSSATMMPTYQNLLIPITVFVLLRSTFAAWHVLSRAGRHMDIHANAPLLVTWIITIALAPVDMSVGAVITMVCSTLALISAYRHQRTTYIYDTWTTSLIHACTTAFFSTMAIVFEMLASRTGSVAYAQMMFLLQRLSAINLSAYLISDLFNPNKPIFVVHHIVAIAAAWMSLLDLCPVEFISKLSVAEWTVPWLYCSKRRICVPWSYVGLLMCHIVFRIMVPFVWIRPALESFVQEQYSMPDGPLSLWTGSVFWTLWYIFLGLQVWWLLTMLWMAYRLVTTKKAPVEHDDDMHAGSSNNAE